MEIVETLLCKVDIKLPTAFTIVAIFSILAAISVISIAVPLTATEDEAILVSEIVTDGFKPAELLKPFTESEITVAVAVSDKDAEGSVIPEQNENHRSSFDEEVPARSIPVVFDEFRGQLILL